MTVTSTTSRNDYAGAGSTGPYTYGFRIYAASDLLVTKADSAGVESTLVYPTDFSATGVSSRTGGTITLSTALAVGEDLTIRRVLPLTQLINLRNQGATFPANVEDGLDQSVMREQQIDNDLQASVRLAETVDPTTFDTRLPANLVAGDAIVVNGAANGFSQAAMTAAQLSAWSATHNMIVDSYTNPGAVSTLTLSTPPGNVNNVTVTMRVGGVDKLLMKDEYSVVGTTLTFTSPLPSPTHVEVAYLYTYQVNTIASENASYSQAGTGAITRTVRDRLREKVSVADFGAVGDGATDNTTFIQAAIDSIPTGSANGVVLYFGTGTFKHSGSITTNGRNLIIRGNGIDQTILEMTSTVSLRHGIKATGITALLRVSDLTMKTSSALIADYAMVAIDIDVSLNPTIPAGSIFEVERVKITGYNFGVYMDGGSSFNIVQGRVTNCLVTTSSDGTIINNHVSTPVNMQRVVQSIIERNSLDASGVGDHGIYGLECTTLHWTENAITGTYSNAVKSVILTVGSAQPRLWHIANNDIHDVQSGIFCYLDNAAFVLPLLRVIGNVINTDTADAAVGGTINITCNTPAVIRHCDLRGNTILNTQVAAVLLQGSGIFHNVNLEDTYVFNWSAGSAGTYGALTDGAGGTKNSVIYSGYFDGNSNGRQPSTMSVFTRIQEGETTVVNTTLAQQPGFKLPAGVSVTRYRPAGFLSSSSTVVSSPANAANNTLVSYTVPANTLTANNRALRVRTYGRCGATGNAKAISLVVGGLVFSSNDITGSPNGTAWCIDAVIIRNALDTQLFTSAMVVGAVAQSAWASGMNLPEAATIAIELKAQTTGVAADVVCYGMLVEYLPEQT